VRSTAILLTDVNLDRFSATFGIGSTGFWDGIVCVPPDRPTNEPAPLARIAYADVATDSPDFGHLEPMITAAQAELADIGINAIPEVVLADAGYWHQVQMDALVDRGMQVLIPPDAGKRKGTRPGWDGGLYAFMRRVLATDRGGDLYAKRQGMIEPVFADTKFNRRCDRFQRRGRSAARRNGA